LYAPGNQHIPLEKEKIIDSKVPAGMGYVSSQEGNYNLKLSIYSSKTSTASTAPKGRNGMLKWKEIVSKRL